MVGYLFIASNKGMERCFCEVLEKVLQTTKKIFSIGTRENFVSNMIATLKFVLAEREKERERAPKDRESQQRQKIRISVIQMDFTFG